MPEKVAPGPVQDSACIREAVCIDTKKIVDSCKEEDIAPLTLLEYRCLVQWRITWYQSSTLGF